MNATTPHDTGDADLVSVIQRQYAALQSLPAFVERSEQKQLAWSIAKTLSDQAAPARLIAAEAPTGVGKTFGYLLGAVSANELLDKKIVIATATTSLQAQLAERDIPAFLQATGIDARVRLAKGRGRYACQYNIDTLLGHSAGQNALDFGADHETTGAWPFPPTRQQVRAIHAISRELDSGAFDGDLDHLGNAIDPAVRGLVTTTRSKCLNRACPFWHSCSFFAARKSVTDADIIVTNHDLVLAHFATANGAGSALPPLQDAIWIFDEAHHLPDKALHHFASSLDAGSAVTKGVNKTFHLLKKHLTLSPAHMDALATVQSTLQTLNELFSRLHGPMSRIMGDASAPAANGVHRFPHGVVPDELRDLAVKGMEPAAAGGEAVTAVRECVLRAIRDGSISSKVGSQFVSATGELLDAYQSWGQVFAAYATTDTAGRPPIARWLERTHANKHSGMTMHASPIRAAMPLRSLWQQMYAVVFVSATLTNLGRFDRFQSAAGLPRQDTRFIRIGSPFALQQQAALQLPAMPDPRNAEAHTRAIVRFLPQTIRLDEATLVLFTSRRQMNAVHESLPGHLARITLLQGDYSRSDILQRHKAAVGEGQGSIIFGLASFAEGIDLPGALCRHVIVAKLPFAVPDTPILATLTEWLEAQGRNPFLDVALPDVALKTTQWCGRLIRTEEDWGRVTILDSRLTTRPFGRALLQSLPPFRREPNPPGGLSLGASSRPWVDLSVS